MYHRLEGYESDNAESYKVLDKVMSVIGGRGIWTMDRGYDNQEIMRYITDKGGRFLIRLTSKRNLIYRGKSVAVRELSKGITRRYIFGNSRYGYRKCYLGDMPVTLIYFVMNNVDLMLLHSGHIGKSVIAKRAIDGYFNRWGVEERYKFIKQSFGIERAQVKKFEGIRNLLGIVQLAWQVLKEVSKDEELKLITERGAQKTSKRRVFFCFYGIARGIQKIFNSCKELYRFRHKKKRKHPIFFSLEDYFNKYDDNYALC
jgi:hypothetical protein